MASDCIDWPYRKLLHFPRGTYHKQTKTEWGRKELDCIWAIYRARMAYARRKRKWSSSKDDDHKYADKALLKILESGND